ncbi:MAG: hypothetical protein ACKOA1_04050, partial [Bacteroidota bacterium]
RELPKSFEGLEIKAIIHGDLPSEFSIDRTQPDWTKKEYIWAPERFEMFVDRCCDDTRKKLGDPQMTRDDMLSALAFGDFNAHKQKTDDLIKEGKLPRYSRN